MRFRVIILIGLLLSYPLLSSGERLYLRDGSVLNGTIETLKADSVYITTSFGTRLAIARGDIVRIVFDEAAARQSESGTNPPATAPAGSLFVFFDKARLSSKIIVHRDRDLQLSLDANSIEQKLFIDQELVFSYLDTLTDKKIRNGAETLYKNTIELKDIKIALPAGPHALRLVIGNTGRREHRERFENAPLLETLERNNVVIYPGRITRLVVDVKKKRWGMGETELQIEE